MECFMLPATKEVKTILISRIIELERSIKGMTHSNISGIFRFRIETLDLNRRLLKLLFNETWI